MSKTYGLGPQQFVSSENTNIIQGWFGELRPALIAEDQDGLEVVYAIKCGQDWKIGKTTNLLNRLNQIQTSNAKTCTLTGVCACQSESTVQKVLKELGIVHRGEWFKDDPKLHRILLDWFVPVISESEIPMGA